MLYYKQFDRKDDLRTLLSKSTGPITIEELSEFLFNYVKVCITEDDFVFEQIIAFEEIVKQFIDEGWDTLSNVLLILTSIKMSNIKKYCEYAEWEKTKKQ
jgi:hypothetical protein